MKKAKTETVGFLPSLCANNDTLASLWYLNHHMYASDYPSRGPGSEEREGRGHFLQLPHRLARPWLQGEVLHLPPEIAQEQLAAEPQLDEQPHGGRQCCTWLGVPLLRPVVNYTCVWF